MWCVFLRPIVWIALPVHSLFNTRTGMFFRVLSNDCLYRAVFEVGVFIDDN